LRPRSGRGSRRRRRRRGGRRRRRWRLIRTLTLAGAGFKKLRGELKNTGCALSRRARQNTIRTITCRSQKGLEEKIERGAVYNTEDF
jgi:hypothetical protein